VFCCSVKDSGTIEEGRILKMQMQQNYVGQEKLKRNIQEKEGQEKLKGNIQEKEGQETLKGNIQEK
jgi:hypothetical protein